MIYLDNSATTAVHPAVLSAMLPYLKEEYGNPSSKYYTLAENAKSSVELARKQVANLLGCDSEEVIFTSGATESNNMILKGIADFYSNKGNHIVTSKVEHPSIMETCKYLESKGFRVTYLDVDEFGRINTEDLKSIVKSEDKPILVSIIWGNNEIGSINEIEDIAAICHQNDVFFHTDATQVLGKTHIDLEKTPGIQFLSCSAHKVFGPKGIGACIIKKHKLGFKTKITPLLHGGGQENEYRSGTLAVHNIVGFGKAAELAIDHLDHNITQLVKLEETVKNLLQEKLLDKITFNNDSGNKIPGLLSIQLKGINNELLIRKISTDIAISTGSACSSSKPSHVLKAIGKDLDEIRSTLRITLSPGINEKELIEALNKIF
jgi:cysteine desulfurase